MIKLKLERGFQLAPIGFIVIELNLLIVCELHLAELRRKVALRGFETFGGQILRLLGTSSIEKAHAGELNSVNNTVAPNQRTLAARGCPDNILTSTSPIRVLKSFKSILMDYSAFRQHDKWMVHVYGSLFKQLMEHQRSKPRNKTLWKNAGAIVGFRITI